MAMSKRTCVLFVVALFFATFSITGQGLAATINVPTGTYPTIQDGINAAVSGVDEVVVAPGTYNEIIDFSGKAITVRSTGGAAVTTIDATGVPDPGDGLPVVRCDTGETASTVLDGFTITGGTGDTSLFSAATPVGGGMFVNNASPTVTNCTFSGNTATNDGGGMYNNGASPTVTNSILWGNSDSGGMDESAQIHTFSGTPVVNYTDLQGGWTGAGGVGNINANPLFVNAVGGDLRLLSGSPCIDAGDNSVVTTTKDVIGQPRKAEDFSTIDTGAGSPPIVDMGAYEFVHRGDADGDGDVDANDFLTFSNCMNGSLNPPKPICLNPNLDLDGDGDIDANDFLTFSNCFNGSLLPPTCP